MTFRHVVSITEAAVVTHVPARTIRRWLDDWRLCDYADTGPALVDANEVEQLAAIRHANGGRLPSLPCGRTVVVD